MTRKDHILHCLFQRLPVFTLILTIFNIVMTLMPLYQNNWVRQNATENAIRIAMKVNKPIINIPPSSYTWLLFIPFIIMFLCKETVKNVRLGLALQIVSCAAFMAGALMFADFRGLGGLLIITFAIILIHSLCSKHVLHDSPFLGFSIGINLFLALTITMSTESVWDYAVVCLPVVIINVLCLYICKYYSNLYFISQTRWWSSQSKKMAASFIKRSSGLMYALMSAVAAVMILIVSFTPIPTVETSSLTTLPSISFVKFWRDTKITPEPVDEEPLQAPPPGDDSGISQHYAEFAEEEEKNYNLDLVVSVFAVILAVIVIIICVLFYKGNDDDEPELYDLEEDLVEARSGRVKRLKTAKKSVSSPNMRVRAAFKRKVNEHRGRGLDLNTSDTARRITVEINATENIDELGAMYHIARYSGETISREDAARVTRPKKQ